MGFSISRQAATLLLLLAICGADVVTLTHRNASLATRPATLTLVLVGAADQSDERRAAFREAAALARAAFESEGPSWTEAVEGGEAYATYAQPRPLFAETAAGGGPLRRRAGLGVDGRGRRAPAAPSSRVAPATRRAYRRSARMAADGGDPNPSTRPSTFRASRAATGRGRAFNNWAQALALPPAFALSEAWLPHLQRSLCPVLVVAGSAAVAIDPATTTLPRVTEELLKALHGARDLRGYLPLVLATAAGNDEAYERLGWFAHAGGADVAVVHVALVLYTSSACAGNGLCDAILKGWDDLRRPAEPLRGNATVATLDVDENDAPRKFDLGVLPAVFYLAPGRHDAPVQLPSRRDVHATFAPNFDRLVAALEGGAGEL
ncbi:hypothetical protein JL720_7631 [Aureococcus anophagefferens]|nr:hypothetical protein JL720_7631 [Aureococcus anophagefferens]